MRHILFCIFTIAVCAAIPLCTQAQTCSNTSLNGKYVFAGQGNVFSGLLCGLGICTDTTMSTVGYIVADGNSKIASARIFVASNSGVSDTLFTGKYNIADCDNGTVTLTSADGSATLNYDIDLDTLDSGNLAHSAAALDADSGIEESLRMSRTVDPAGCGAGSTLLNGLNYNGEEQGVFGSKESGVVTNTFGNDGATFTGSQKISSGSGVTPSSYTGKYSINPDCSVPFTLTLNGSPVAGAHVISGGDPLAPPLHDFVLQGDALMQGWLHSSLPNSPVTVW